MEVYGQIRLKKSDECRNRKTKSNEGAQTRKKKLNFRQVSKKEYERTRRELDVK